MAMFLKVVSALMSIFFFRADNLPGGSAEIKVKTTLFNSLTLPSLSAYFLQMSRRPESSTEGIFHNINSLRT